MGMHHGTRILVLSIAQALAASAAAQDDGANAAEGATAQLAEVVVVGSRIRRVVSVVVTKVVLLWSMVRALDLGFV